MRPLQALSRTISWARAPGATLPIGSRPFLALFTRTCGQPLGLKV